MPAIHRCKVKSRFESIFKGVKHVWKKKKSSGEESFPDHG